MKREMNATFDLCVQIVGLNLKMIRTRHYEFMSQLLFDTREILAHGNFFFDNNFRQKMATLMIFEQEYSTNKCWRLAIPAAS